MRIPVSALAVSMGLVGALVAFVLAMAVMYLGWGTAAMQALAAFYPSYAATWSGAVVGSIWAFVVWCVIGIVFSWVHDQVKARM